MSGHSHSKNVGASKQKNDAKKSALYSKLSKEITAAAKVGGSDATYNAKLRSLLETAKKNGMKKDSIERAIKNAKK
jgi:transcriptional/translational regulatory protein YebC/TACO1